MKILSAIIYFPGGDEAIYTINHSGNQCSYKPFDEDYPIYVDSMRIENGSLVICFDNGDHNGPNHREARFTGLPFATEWGERP